jgi:hypothetical protein
MVMYGTDDSYQVIYVNRFFFRLQNGKCYRHLFTWTFDPNLQDFENLVRFCYSIMVREDLQIVEKEKKNG